MSSRRRRRTPKVDIISELPDSIICHILSFLPTRQSVSTTILSKRWRPLWKSVPILDFDGESFPDFATFCHFIDSVIASRHPTLTLQSFRIRVGQDYIYNVDYLDPFINAALRWRIENLELDVSFKRLYHAKKLVPTLLTVFSCKTLVVLKLRCLMVCEVPHLVHLPLLKSLHLEDTPFLKFRHFMNLLRGCPILEELDTNDVQFDDNSLEGEEFKGITNLVRANLYYLTEETFPFAWLHNTKFLCVELITNYDYRVPTFHNLTHMKLIFNYKLVGVKESSCPWDGKWKWLIQVLQHCPKLQSLTIDEASDYEPTEDKKWKSRKLFRNVFHLSLEYVRLAVTKAIGLSVNLLSTLC